MSQTEIRDTVPCQIEGRRKCSERVDCIRQVPMIVRCHDPGRDKVARLRPTQRGNLAKVT